MSGPDTHFGLLSLPSELLHEILRHLECRDLLTCCLVCKLLNKGIKSTTELLYTIELYKNGMIDTGYSSVSYADRLASLQDRHRGWRDLAWKKVVTVDVQGACSAYELVGGVFAKSSGHDLFFSWLPSATNPGRTIHHQNVGLFLRDFAIDPTQDLVVLLEEDRMLFQEDWSRGVWLHLWTMSTLKPHPKAHTPDLHFKIRHLPSANRMVSAFVQIAADVLAVFVSLGFETTRLVMWNWERGELLCDLGEEEMHPSSWDFALISPRSFMVTTNEDEGAILLFSFSYPHKTQPVHVATLQMPPLKDNHVVTHMSSHSGPFLAHPPQGTIFSTGPDSRIQVISAAYQDRSVPFGNSTLYFFYLHNKTLQSYIDRWAEALEPPGVVYVPWEEWGPGKCTVRYIRSQTHWLRYAHGARVVCPPEFRAGHIMQIWDFNLRGPRLQYKPDYPIITADSPFKYRVRPSLPYRAGRRTVNEAYKAFMLDEERVIGLKVNPSNNEDVVALDVYCL